jgi:hypothetical protein
MARPVGEFVRLPTGCLWLQRVEQAQRVFGETFAGAGFGITVEAGPCLVPSEAVARGVGQVADPVVGEFGDQGVGKG